MPLGTQPSAGPALALENQAIEREIADRVLQQQARAAASDFAADVPARLRQAVQAAQQRVRSAERALEQADVQARLKIQRERPSEQLARTWHEEMTLRPARDLELARQELSSVELALGRQVQARQELRQLEADAPHARAAAKAAYDQALAEIETRLVGARMRVVD